MTDKVQKIKDWISKEQDGLMDAQGNFEYPEHEGAYHILCNLDAYIDSLQEKPVFKVGDTIQKKDNNSIRYSIINKTSDGYRALRGLSDTIVIWFSEQDQWELVEEHVSDDLVIIKENKYES